jgi:ParB-like chromosome segregation protein Spo0J
MTTPPKTHVAMVSCGLLQPMPENPNHMSDDEYATLVTNTRADGCSQSLLVRDLDHDVVPRYEIIDGEHRWRAAQEAGITEVPCIIRQWSREKAVMYRLAMNKIRGRLNLTEVGRDMRWLIEECGVSAEELSVTGFAVQDIGELLEATKSTANLAEQVLADAGAILDDANESPPAPAATFDIEIEARSAKEKRLIMRRLKKLSNGAPLVVGLLRALGEEDPS